MIFYYYVLTEGGASGQSMEERERAVAQLESVFRATNYHYHIVHLEQVSCLEMGQKNVVCTSVWDVRLSFDHWH